MKLSYSKPAIDIINSIMLHPDVLESIKDDHSEAMNFDQLAEMVLRSPQTIMLHPADGILFMLTPRTLTLFEVHTMIVPKARGIKAVEATKRATQWVFANTPCEKIITYVPEFNRPAKIFAKKMGMVDEGICTKSFKRNGKLIDQWVLGLEKEKFICQQSQQ